MLNRIAGAVILLLALLLSAGAAYWLLVMSKADDAVSERVLSAEPVRLINQLQQMDSIWSLAALRTQAVPNSDFDQVASFLPKIRAGRDKLLESELASSDVPQSMNSALMSFINLLKAKEESIEYFKSNHAVIRNSMKYLPLSEAALLKASAGDRTSAKLQTQVQSLSERLRSFLQTPTEATKNDLLSELLQLDEASIAYSPKVANSLQNFVSHARVLVERKLFMNDLVSRVIDDSAVQAGNELLEDYDDLRQRRNGTFYERAKEDGKLSNKLTLGVIVGLGLLGVIAGLLLVLAKAEGLSKKQFERKLAEQTEPLEKALQDARSRADAAVQTTAAGSSREQDNSVALMAATMAHEINTPLGYLSSNLEVLNAGFGQLNSVMSEFEVLARDLSEMSEPSAISSRVQSFQDMLNASRDSAMMEDLPEIIKDMSGGVEQIESLVADLRDFGREAPADQGWFDLNDTVRRVLKMTVNQGEGKVELKTQLSDVPKIYGSPGQVARVLTNISNNAFQAAAEKGGGTVAVTTKMNGEKEILIGVMDNGNGMDESTKVRIFEPFFTTKAPGKGTGLGLPIVKRIVQTHKGRIGLKTVPGKGTNFQVVLPVNSTEA